MKGAVGAVCTSSAYGMRSSLLPASTLVVGGLTAPASLEAIACNGGASLALDIGVTKCFVVSDCLLKL